MSSYPIGKPERSAASLEKEVADCRNQIAQHKDSYSRLRFQMQAEIDRLRGLLREAGHPDYQTTVDVGRDRT